MLTTRPVTTVRRGLTLLAALVVLAGLVPAASLAVAPTSAPTLTSPAEGELVTGNPVLIWTAVSGAAKYRVQVSVSPTFSPLAYNVDTVNLRATPPTDLPLGTLYWRVAGLDSSANLGPYASTGSFIKGWGDAPNPIAPADLATLDFPANPVLFTWDPLPGAKTYTLEIDNATDFIGATQYTTNNTNFTLTEPQTVGQTFYWHVKGNAASGISSAWSETRSYTYSWSATPTLLTPTDTATGVTDVVFGWQPVPGASTYQLQVSPNGDWANNLTLDQSGIKGTRFSPSTTIDNGSYFWRVRAKDASSAGNYGAWSTEFTFTRGWPDRPQEVAPAWDKNDPTVIPTVGELTLSWTPVPHASYYEVWIGTDVNFSGGTYSVCYTNRTQVTPYATVSGSNPAPGGCTIPIHDLTLYYWKVRGIDGPRPVLGLWSANDAASTWRFIYQTGTINQLAPSDGVTVETPVLSWSPVYNVERYQVSIYKSDKTTLAKRVTTYATSYTPDTLTPADGPFYWYVQTIDGTGNTSGIPGSGSWWSFSLTDPTTDTTFAILNPPDASSSVRMPSIQWQPYTGASYYKVWYGPVGGSYSATPLSGGTQLKFAAFTYASLTLSAGSYKFYVQAFNSSNVSLAVSAEQTFVINAADTLGLADYLTPDRCAVLTSCITEADTPSFTWNPVPGAGAYKVIFANDAAFTNQIVAFKTIFNRLTPRGSFVDSQASHAIYWFVLPCVDYTLTRCGPSEQTSANVNAGAFRKRSAAVDLVGPPDDPTHASPVADQVTFTWREYLDTNSDLVPAVTQEARNYKIDVSTAADFSSILDTATVDQLTYTAYAKTYPEGPLYWRVQAYDQSGNPLTVSPAWQLTKSSPVPTQTFPGDGDTVSGVPYLAWDPLDYAATYTVEVYKNGDTGWSSGNRVLTQTTKFAAWAPTTSLARGPYAWRVRRTDAGGNVGGWSAGATFNLFPAAPTLVSPADGTSFSSHTLFFTWGGVAGAASYKWDASLSPTFTTLASSQATVMSAWAPTAALADNTYYWRVSAIDAAGNVISTSSSRSFSIDALPPSVTAKTPTSAASITGSFSVTFSEPVTNVDETSFTMVVAGTATTVAGTVTTGGGGTTATFKPSTILVPGQSYTLRLSGAIQDLAGNPLAATSWTVRTSTTVEQSSPAVVEVWDRDTSASANGGGYSANRVVGSSATFTFTGTDVTLIGRKAVDGGKASVYLDGVLKATLSFYRSSTQWKVPMWTASSLAAGTHTVKVLVLGTRATTSATSTWVYLDAFTVGATTYQETDASVRYAFRRITTSLAYGSSYDTVDHLASGDTGARPLYRVVFRGTRVYVYGTKTTSSGKATIYIDGVAKGTVDLYGTTKYRALLFTSATLTNAVHTIEIRLYGTKNSASHGYAVGIDRLVLK